MSRLLVLSFLILSIVGCGASGNGTGNSANGDANAVAVESIKQEKVGTVSMKQLCETAGLKPYPGSESAVGDLIRRSTGEMKDDISFTTSDSIDKVADFYKQQGLDTKVLGSEASSIGATKKNAQVMILMKLTEDHRCEVNVKSIHADTKGP